MVFVSIIEIGGYSLIYDGVIRRNRWINALEVALEVERRRKELRMLCLTWVRKGVYTSYTFQDYIEGQHLQTAQASNGEDALNSAKQAATSALLAMARTGIGVGSKGSYFAGEALVWTRMDYEHRRNVMTDTVIDFLSERTQSKNICTWKQCNWKYCA